MAGFVQGKTGTVSGGTSGVITFTSSVTAANFIACSLQSANTAGFTVSDNKDAGNFTVSNNHSTANTSNDLALAFKENTAGGASFQVTCTVTNAGNMGIAIGEYSGVLTSASADTNGATEGTGANVTTTSQTSTGANGDLLLANEASASGTSTITNTTSGWTLNVTNTPNATMNATLASRVQASSGAFTTTYTDSTAEDQAIIAASFKLAAVASATTPSITRAVQKGKQLRPLSDPRIPLGTNQFGAQWLPAPVFNSGSIKPLLPIKAIQKPPFPSRALAGFGINPSTVKIGSVWIKAPIFNSGGLIPIVTKGVQKSKPFRANSRFLSAPIFNSGSLTPVTILKAVQKPVPSKPKSNYTGNVENPQWIKAPVFNSGGLIPLTVQAIQKKPVIRTGSLLDRTPPKWLLAPVFNSGGITPLTFKAVQKPKPFRANSRFFRPPVTVVAPGIPPIVTRATQKPRPFRANSKPLPAPRFNSGSISPVIILKSVQKAPQPSRPHSRSQVAPLYNSGGIQPIVSIAFRRPPAKPKLSRIVIPTLAYIPVFIRPNPLAYTLNANPIAQAAQQGNTGFTIYGLGVYGRNVFNQTAVSGLVQPLAATASTSPANKGQGNALAFPLRADPKVNPVV